MQTALTEEAGHRVVRVSGDVDLDSSPQLLAVLQRALRGADVVVADLAGVQYIDSSGIAVLIQALKQAARTGAAFRLRDPSKAVLGVLELAELHRVFDIHHTEDDA